MTPTLRVAHIDAIEKLTPFVYEFTLSFPDHAPLHFHAGQYGTVIINASTRRQYSFCSSPTQIDAIHFVIDIKPMGLGSVYFLERKVGDTIQMLSPLGTFTVIPSPRKKIMIATGTGIAPIKSMILDTITTAPIQLLWGLRHEEDMYWHEEFTSFSRTYPTFSYMVTLSQPADSWTGTRGRVTDYMKDIENKQEHDYYLCGNKQMIQDVQTHLLAHGVPEGHIKTELF